MRAFAAFRILGLVAVTLLTVAFATGTVGRAAPSVTDMYLSAYQLQGGLLSDLCHDTPDHAHEAGCSLCHLVAASNLPDVNLPLIRAERARVAAIILPQIRRAAARPHDPATPTRGPPQA
ncbi:hypothetical protein [Falsirhodobacter halotolerans]|uniref:hypothetical protein n=1 Tax=Falsirhodobacter halotolerans TaxID=1146892 RepID=UPI001FD462EA|nr:hypothetical protein [Falsirhodobacter halotolerans]MCJ8140018.1 hypothetical protein [Falsirhodobacter halotolerans]